MLCKLSIPYRVTRKNTKTIRYGRPITVPIKRTMRVIWKRKWRLPITPWLSIGVALVADVCFITVSSHCNRHLSLIIRCPRTDYFSVIVRIVKLKMQMRSRAVSGRTHISNHLLSSNFRTIFNVFCKAFKVTVQQINANIFGNFAKNIILVNGRN